MQLASKAMNGPAVGPGVAAPAADPLRAPTLLRTPTLLRAPARLRLSGTAVAQTRRVARAVAIGSGGLSLAGALLTSLAVGQAVLARRAIPPAELPPPRCCGRYGDEHRGTPLRMVLLGDSSAAGYGVDAPRHTLGALLAAGLAEQRRQPVDLTCLAVVGAQSRDLLEQAGTAVGQRPDVAVIMIGANDVTHRVPVSTAVDHLAAAVRRLRAAGAEVVVGTCPDLGTVPPFQPPLRWLARHLSRRMAAAQTIAAVRAGARTVSLGDLLGPAFDAEPDRMFAGDRFHPSAAGYRAVAAVLLPTTLAALTGDEPGTGGAAGRFGPGSDPTELASGVATLSRAASAARHPGTEVSAPAAAGWPDRLVQLRHRVWRRTQRPTDPTPTDPTPTDPTPTDPTPTVRAQTTTHPATTE